MSDETIGEIQSSGNPVVDAARTEAAAEASAEQKFIEDRRNTRDSIDKTLDAAFERLQEQEAPIVMPDGMRSGVGSIEQAFERTSQWLDMPVEERKSLATASEDIAARRAEADRLGITLEQHAALTAIEAGKSDQRQAAAYEPAAAVMRAIYPEAHPSEVAQRYAEIDRFVRADPVAGLRWLAEQYGVDPRQIAPAPQAPAQPQDVRSAVVNFAESKPDWVQHQGSILAEMNSGRFAFTGNTEADLQRAYDVVKSRIAAQPARERPKPRKGNWEETLQRIGAEVTAR